MIFLSKNFDTSVERLGSSGESRKNIANIFKSLDSHSFVPHTFLRHIFHRFGRFSRPESFIFNQKIGFQVWVWFNIFLLHFRVYVENLIFVDISSTTDTISYLHQANFLPHESRKCQNVFVFYFLFLFYQVLTNI